MQVPVDSVEAVRELRTRSSLAETVHPHPTLSETLMECAEAFLVIPPIPLRGKKSWRIAEIEKRCARKIGLPLCNESPCSSDEGLLD